MIIQTSELETVCGITSTLPTHDVIEMAFWGRSNVGKSSLLNTLWGRKKLARISSEPGKTQTINYYHIVGKGEGSDYKGRPCECYMVDLPGYGYAKTSREITAKWMKMIMKYLDLSLSLRVIFLLIDIRHAPTADDIDIYHKLYERGFNPLIIATKTDKIKKSEIKKNTSVIQSVLQLSDDAPIIPFSAKNGQGRDEVWEYIEYFINEIKI